MTATDKLEVSLFASLLIIGLSTIFIITHLLLG
jgi:hypothetical protein